MEDEAKSFLSALVEKEALFFFFLSFISILLIVFNNSTVGTYTLNIQPISINILTGTSVIFGGIGIWQLTKKSTKSNQKSAISTGDNATQVILSSRKELLKITQEQKGIIESLKRSIKDIQSIAVQERSYASGRILDIIEKLNIALIDYQESSLDAQRLSQWTRVRIDIWIDKISLEDYPNIAKIGNFQLFKEDICKYLNLLCENIVSGIFKTPQKQGIKPHFDYVFAYKDALRFIRKQIILEIERDEYPDLNQGQRQEILDCLDQIIDDI